MILIPHDNQFLAEHERSCRVRDIRELLGEVLSTYCLDGELDSSASKAEGPEDAHSQPGESRAVA